MIPFETCPETSAITWYPAFFIVWFCTPQWLWHMLKACFKKTLGGGYRGRQAQHSFKGFSYAFQTSSLFWEENTSNQLSWDSLFNQHLHSKSPAFREKSAFPFNRWHSSQESLTKGALVFFGLTKHSSYLFHSKSVLLLSKNERILTWECILHVNGGFLKWGYPQNPLF